jgi:hypothetical protein
MILLWKTKNKEKKNPTHEDNADVKKAKVTNNKRHEQSETISRLEAEYLTLQTSSIHDGPTNILFVSNVSTKKNKQFITLQKFTTVENVIFYVVTPCSLVRGRDWSQRPSVLKTGAAGFSETFLPACRVYGVTTQNITTWTINAVYTDYCTYMLVHTVSHWIIHC